MCLCPHVRGAAAFGSQRCQRILELESQAAVTCLVLVLGNKLGSSTGAACALDGWLIPPSLSWVLEARGWGWGLAEDNQPSGCSFQKRQLSSRKLKEELGRPHNSGRLSHRPFTHSVKTILWSPLRLVDEVPVVTSRVPEVSPAGCFNFRVIYSTIQSIHSPFIKA